MYFLVSQIPASPSKVDCLKAEHQQRLKGREAEAVFFSSVRRQRLETNKTSPKIWAKLPRDYVDIPWNEG